MFEKQRGVEDMVRVMRGTAWELSGLCSTQNFINKLEINNSTVNYKISCFRGAKSLCYLTQPHEIWTSFPVQPAGTCLAITHHRDHQGARVSLGPSPFLLNFSNLSCLILKTLYYVYPPVWMALSCTSSPKGATASPTVSGLSEGVCAVVTP